MNWKLLKFIELFFIEIYKFRREMIWWRLKRAYNRLHDIIIKTNMWHSECCNIFFWQNDSEMPYHCSVEFGVISATESFHDCFRASMSTWLHLVWRVVPVLLLHGPVSSIAERWTKAVRSCGRSAGGNHRQRRALQLRKLARRCEQKTVAGCHRHIRGLFIAVCAVNVLCTADGQIST